jgi:hypothetical protein
MKAELSIIGTIVLGLWLTCFARADVKPMGAAAPIKQEVKQPTPTPKESKTWCVVSEDKVPKCVVLGTFPDNPNWQVIINKK